MPKLTDTQLVILAAAAQRDDGTALPLPESLKIRGGAVARVLQSLLKKDLIAERPATMGAEAWRETEDGKRVTLAITDAGLKAIGIEPGQGPTPRARARKDPSKPRRRGARRATKAKPATAGSAATVRPGTKQALLIDLLRRDRGATIAEIGAATGWQAHSVRGAISGAVRKKLGLTVASTLEDGRGRVYRIAGSA